MTQPLSTGVAVGCLLLSTWAANTQQRQLLDMQAQH